MYPGPLNQNDNFSFNCITCGECCSGTMEVFLNPEDLLRIASHLGYNHTLELWKNKYVITEKGQNGTLLPRLKFAGLAPGFCPFLINKWDHETENLRGLCSIHRTAKPLICRLAPIAREIDLDEDTEEYYFKEPVSGCPGSGERVEINFGEYLTKLRPMLEREKLWFRLMKEELDHDVSAEALLQKFFHLPAAADFSELLKKWEAEIFNHEPG